MPIGTENAPTLDHTSAPGAANRARANAPTNDRFGEILPLVGTEVMGAKQAFVQQALYFNRF